MRSPKARSQGLVLRLLYWVPSDVFRENYSPGHGSLWLFSCYNYNFPQQRKILKPSIPKNTPETTDFWCWWPMEEPHHFKELLHIQSLLLFSVLISTFFLFSLVTFDILLYQLLFALPLASLSKHLIILKQPQPPSLAGYLLPLTDFCLHHHCKLIPLPVSHPPLTFSITTYPYFSTLVNYIHRLYLIFLSQWTRRMFHSAA